MNELFISYLQMIDNAILREQMGQVDQAIVFWKNALRILGELNDGMLEEGEEPQPELFIGRYSAFNIAERIDLLLTTFG